MLASAIEPLDMGPVYEEIGQIAVEEMGGKADGLLIYAEVKRGAVVCSIANKTRKSVTYKGCSDTLSNRIGEAWKSLSTKHRWVAMTYSIEKGRFDAGLEYPEQLKQGETFDVRWQRALQIRYGEKPAAAAKRVEQGASAIDPCDSPLADCIPASPHPNGGPDYGNIDSWTKTYKLVANGDLVPLLLLPENFGGQNNKENTIYVPPFAAELSKMIRESAIDGTASRYRVEPSYSGKSFVPISIRLVAPDSTSYAFDIAIWGDALEPD